jgi:hypothetical protein
MPNLYQREYKINLLHVTTTFDLLEYRVRNLKRGECITLGEANLVKTLSNQLIGGKIINDDGKEIDVKERYPLIFKQIKKDYGEEILV